MVGFDSSDDAAVYRVNDETAMIATVDFFPPIVDDPFQFGQVAATNALSDVWAMGGTPKIAMNLLTFPNCLPLEVVQGILAGGYDKVMEAGAVIVGGHSIEDKEPKYGLCVMGFAHPDEVLTNDGAKEGDILVLTKPLGTGILSTAAKAGLLTQAEYDEMLAIMTTLNKKGQEAMLPVHPTACTDITVFRQLQSLGDDGHRVGPEFKAQAASRAAPTTTWAIWPMMWWWSPVWRWSGPTPCTIPRRQAACSSRCPNPAPVSSSSV